MFRPSKNPSAFKENWGKMIGQRLWPFDATLWKSTYITYLHHLPTSLTTSLTTTSLTTTSLTTTSLTTLTYITYLRCYNLSSNYITREIEAVNDPFYRHKIRSLTQKVKYIPKRKFESSSLPRPRLVVYLVLGQNCIRWLLTLGTDFKEIMIPRNNILYID